MYLADAFEPESHGLAAVLYDDGGVTSHLGAVRYDGGGRMRVLLGQDSVDIVPPDVGLDPNYTQPFPIDYTPPSIAPSFIPATPTPIVDTTPTPVSGGLIPPSQGAAPISGNLLTDILNAAKTIIPLATGASTGQGIPHTAGTLVATPGGIQPTASSWFSQPSALGVPNWGMLAGFGVAVAVVLGVAASSSGGGGGRRRNPAELILMGANPHRARRRRA